MRIEREIIDIDVIDRRYPWYRYIVENISITRFIDEISNRPQQPYYMDSLPGPGPVFVRSDSLELTKIYILM